ncbi:orotidine-5'-phosphate decarboxylase [Leptolyngbya sp. AN02str]|uniref:orotidine-5'-phosphate decarboxylase n=1 Tax=Leptolyngbya sp. AN02str TaxID=3423363 RepID=UPI003D315CC6
MPLPDRVSDRVSDRVIVALDVSTEAAAIALVERIPEVSFWKVGLELFTSVGPSILTLLKEREKRIFLDLKFHDIPNTMAGACRAAGRYGVDLLTLHATAGKDALAASVASAQEGAAEAGCASPNLLAITVLTSITSHALALDLKIPLELPDYALQMALLAQESGLAGAVCSPQEAAHLRQVCGSDFLLVCPGVRPAFTAQADQRRTMTPAQALKAGVSYMVIGRPITTDPDPAAAFARVCAELEEAP